jgi:sugar phosphate isomerase/epimerase
MIPRHEEVRKVNLDRVGILTDEVSPRFDEALDWIVAQGLPYVEIRVVDGRNVAEFDEAEAREVKRKLDARGLAVAGISSPLFKCALDPARPVASGDTFGQKEEGVEAHFAKLERVIRTAKILDTKLIRVFSFWREVEPLKYEADIVRHLKRAADVAAKAGVLLMVENEPSCNGGFAEEVGRIVRAVGSPAVRALWDPGNEAYGGREAYPAGYDHVKDVLAHVHLKDAYHTKAGTARCVPVGSGEVDWLGQFRALASDGYAGLFVIETHFAPAGAGKATGCRMTLDGLRANAGE